MDKVYLSTIRDIWFNKSRSLVVILALIMVVCFPIAFLNVAPNLNTIIITEQDDYNLAHYNIFLDTYRDDDLTDNVTEWISEYLDIQQDQFIVEAKQFEGSKMKAFGRGELDASDWITLDVMSVDYTNPPQISKLEITEGRLPRTGDEIAILHSLAKIDGMQIGDEITLYDQAGKINYEISGFVKSIEYSSYDLSQTGAAFMSYEGFQKMEANPDLEGKANEISVYFDFDIPKEDLLSLSDHLKQKFKENGINLALFWFVRETSFRKALLDALNLTSQYMIAASIFIFLVAGVVIFVVTNRYITEQKTRIGALYAFGVRRRHIMFSFFVRIFLLGIISVILGMLFAQLLLAEMVQQLVNQWGLIGFSADITSNSVIFTLISAAVVSYAFTFLAVSNLIKLTPYEAMRGKTSELKNRGFFFKLTALLPTKLLRGASKNLTRNRTRTILTIIAFTLALTFAGSLLYTEQSLEYTINDFYDETVNFDVEVNLGYPVLSQPNNSIVQDIINSAEISQYEYYINSLVQLSKNPDTLTYLLGFQQNTTMYDISENNIIEGRWFEKNSSGIVISKYIEAQYGYQVGDRLGFEYFGLKINGTIVGITNDILYNSAILADFDYINYIVNKINPLYESMEQEVLISNKILLKLREGVSINQFQNDLNENNPTVEIALTQTSFKRRSIALSDSQTAIIFLMVALGLIVGVVSVFTTLLIAIVERERELALLRVFGYKRYELLLQIIVEGIFIGIISLLPTYFLARLIATDLWMQIVSENLYVLKPLFSLEIDIFLGIFALISISISIIPAFRSAISRKLSETIREE